MYHTQSNSFSMLFAMGNGHRGGYDDAGDMYSSSYTTSAAAAPPSASVDCTLSLGTPSTRLSNENNIQNHHQYEKKRSSCMSNFGWNILPSSKQTPASSAVKGHRGGNGNCNSSGGSGDPLLARRCANCDTTSTPLWRNGPRGPKSLCNACGIRYKKEERRATAAAASSNVGGGAHGSHVVDAAQYGGGSSWGGGHHQPQKTPCYSSSNYGNEYRFMEDDVVVDHRDSEIPFMSWRFNVTDRTGLVHDFTR